MTTPDFELGAQADSPASESTSIRLALDALDTGRLSEARAFALRAVEADLPRPGIRAAAGQVLHLSRDHASAVDQLRIAAAGGDAAAAPLGALYALGLGWYSDASEFVHAMHAPAPDSHRVASLVCRTIGQFENALEHAASLVKYQPESRNWLELAQVRLEAAPSLGLSREELGADLKRALKAAPSDGDTALAAATLFRRAGMLRPARALLRQLIGRPATAQAAKIATAELELWLGRTDSARELVEGIDDPSARRVRGAVSVLERRYDDALREFGTRAKRADDYESLLWQAEALFRTGRLAEAQLGLHRAAAAAPGFVPALGLLSSLLALESHPDRAPDLGDVDDLRETLAAAGQLPDVPADDRDPAARLEHCLRILSGNRTASPTILVEGRLIALPPLFGVSAACAQATRLILAGEPEIPLRALDEVVAEYPGNALPLACRGEAELWLGRIDQARASLNQSIALSPTDARPWAALAQTALVDGNAAECFRVIDQGIAATGWEEWAYGCRGEALLAQGRPGDAVADLTRAAQFWPSIGTSLALVVARHESGESDVAVAQREIMDRAPGLMSDAAAEASVTLWRGGSEPEMDAVPLVCATALRMLSGNRSARTPTYRTRGGRLRSMWMEEEPALGGLCERSIISEARARSGSLSKTAGRAVAAQQADSLAVARLPKPLSESQVTAFIEQGWLKLDGAFDRDLAAEWRTRAAERIRTDPDRFVRGHAYREIHQDEHGVYRRPSNEETRPDLSNFDVSDPATWGQARIDYNAPLTTEFAEFSPRLWGAVNQLLGVERVRTQRIAEFLILNLSLASDSAISEEHSWASWHLDAPKTEQSLENIEVGLLLVLLFSDVGPNMGATAIAPDSLGLVSRRLGDSSEPVDFVDLSETDRIMAQSREREFLTGKAGDAYLLHPLMMHSVSPNPSGIIRWMANPVLFMTTPLQVDDGTSPVERAIRNAVSG